MKLTAAQERLLREAGRRLVKFHPTESMTKAWSGLGTVAQYRPVVEAGLMEHAHDGTPPPRILAWWRLTQAGAEALRPILIADRLLGEDKSK